MESVLAVSINRSSIQEGSIQGRRRSDFLIVAADVVRFIRAAGEAVLPDRKLPRRRVG